jgi:hypothetical protein
MPVSSNASTGLTGLKSIGFLTYENNITLDGLAVPTLQFE